MVIGLWQACPSAIFRICDASCGACASAELLISSKTADTMGYSFYQWYVLHCLHACLHSHQYSAACTEDAMKLLLSSPPVIG